MTAARKTEELPFATDCPAFDRIGIAIRDGDIDDPDSVGFRRFSSIVLGGMRIRFGILPFGHMLSVATQGGHRIVTEVVGDVGDGHPDDLYAWPCANGTVGFLGGTDSGKVRYDARFTVGDYHDVEFDLAAIRKRIERHEVIGFSYIGEHVEGSICFQARDLSDIDRTDVRMVSVHACAIHRCRELDLSIHHEPFITMHV